MSDLLAGLSGGDRRSIGRAEEVVAEVLQRREALAEVFEGLEHADPVVRMRAADVVEKVSRARPEWLGPYKARLIGPIAGIDQQEVQWHVAQMIPRLELAPAEQTLAVEVLTRYMRDSKSRIVQANALEALAELARRDPALRDRAVETIRGVMQAGSPAVVGRGRKMLDTL